MSSSHVLFLVGFVGVITFLGYKIRKNQVKDISETEDPLTEGTEKGDHNYNPNPVPKPKAPGGIKKSSKKKVTKKKKIG